MGYHMLARLVGRKNKPTGDSFFYAKEGVSGRWRNLGIGKLSRSPHRTGRPTS